MLGCMATIHETVVAGIVDLLNTHFRFVTVREAFVERIKVLCERTYREFIGVFQMFVDSQVMCISVSESDFWKLNPVNTSLYANQILIELKFIGNNYVKKIIESLKELVPRMIS